MDTQKIAAEGFAAAGRHRRDRESRRTGRDDRVRTAILIDQREELFLERQILRQRLENQARFADRPRQVVVVGAERDTLRDRVGPGVILHVEQGRGGLVAGAREQRDGVARAREYASGAGAHGAVGTDNYDLVVLGQVILRSA